MDNIETKQLSKQTKRSILERKFDFENRRRSAKQLRILSFLAGILVGASLFFICGFVVRIDIDTFFFRVVIPISISYAIVLIIGDKIATYLSRKLTEVNDAQSRKTINDIYRYALKSIIESLGTALEASCLMIQLLLLIDYIFGI